MSEGRRRSGRTMFECVDSDFESVPSSENNRASSDFHHVKAFCGGLPYPPYVDHKELTCAVCTR